MTQIKRDTAKCPYFFTKFILIDYLTVVSAVTPPSSAGKLLNTK